MFGTFCILNSNSQLILGWMPFMKSPLSMIESLKFWNQYHFQQQIFTIKTIIHLPLFFVSFLLLWFVLLQDEIFRNQTRDQIFWNQDFLSETKFSKTETDTFFRDQIFWNCYRDFFPRPNFPKLKPKLFSNRKFFGTDTKTLKKWQKSQIREFSKPKCHTLVQWRESWPTDSLRWRISGNNILFG